MVDCSIYMGWDAREETAFKVAAASIAHFTDVDSALPVNALRLQDQRNAGLYWREHRTSREGPNRDIVNWDVISEAPMSTEFALTRFLVPHIARTGWALFCDCDIMVRADLDELFALADDRFAVQVVKHGLLAHEGAKMDGQFQTAYPRKNWSSVMLFNCDHPGHAELTLEYINTAPGRELHALSWLSDVEIGELPAEWNHLVSVDKPNPDAKLAHFTLGTPDMHGYQDCEFADEWRAWL